MKIKISDKYLSTSIKDLRIGDKYIYGTVDPTRLYIVYSRSVDRVWSLELSTGELYNHHFSDSGCWKVEVVSVEVNIV